MSTRPLAPAVARGCGQPIERLVQHGGSEEAANHREHAWSSARFDPRVVFRRRNSSGRFRRTRPDDDT